MWLWPDVVEAAAGVVGAQGEDAGGAGDVPAHAGQFQAPCARCSTSAAVSSWICVPSPLFRPPSGPPVTPPGPDRVGVPRRSPR